MNTEGNRYCTPSSGSDLYKTWVKNQLAFIAKNDGCHTSERSGCTITRNNNNDLFKNLEKSKLDVENYAQLRSIAQCTQRMFFPMYGGGVTPTKKTCPKLFCDSKMDGACAKRLADASGNKNFTLNGCTNSSKICELTMADLYTDEFTEKKCVDKGEEKLRRFPGEKCNKAEDCFTGGMGCVSSKCNATNTDGTCASNLDCVAGKYCNGTKCVDQLAAKANCTKTTACRNELGCYDGKCIE